MNESNANETKRFLFTVDILIEDESNGRALETLLHHLNSAKIKDYQIKSGIELGKAIQTALMEAKVAELRSAGKKESSPNAHLFAQMQKFKDNNTLVRLTIVKGMGVKLSVPCRVINFDPASENVTVYHVDEKKVYLFKVNEIDDVQVG
ncbi:hypothetical protein [Paenibacillus hamazuiensis]|uniref:hypothetical protein n=1 Tax=Paenibacillus hamazuiensis TaxID=2936508 RepID=UPI00200FA3A3|nr:hypothetical protein [Paenibacillus hamazuiensis]